MTQFEFNLQPHQGQLEIISMLGFVIGERIEKRYSYVFYCLDDFFVEVKYKRESLNGIRTFKDPSQMHLFANKMSLLHVF